MAARTPWPYLALALAAGAGGFALGRASAPQPESGEHVDGRAASTDGDGPLLQGLAPRRTPGRGGGGSGAPPPPTRSDAAAAPASGDAPAQPAAQPSVVLRLGSRELVLSEPVLPDGGVQEALEAQEAGAPESARARAAREALAAEPERATALLEDLLASGDPDERRAAYALLSTARHPQHRALVTRAAQEAKPDDPVRPLLDALARYKGPAWAAVQMTGPPDTPLDGDLPTAWASKSPDMGEVWIDLDYAVAVVVDAVRVHETLGPGCVARVLLAEGEDPEGEPRRWVQVWSGTATAGPSPRWFEPPLDGTRFTRHVRLIVDTSRSPGWNELDAVELVGGGLRQWAVAARAGSSYAD